MPESEIYYPEDGEWTQEDVDRFIESVEEEYDVETGGGDDEVSVHPGTVVVGILIALITIYSIYIQEFQFAGLNLVLLVLLALGSKAMN